MREQYVNINLENITLEGILDIPNNACGLVLFAHGSGSSRLSPRNNFVAKALQDNGIGTLLFDLLTGDEDAEYSIRFNIDLLSERLILTTKWVLSQPHLQNYKIGYFGASTGAAAAIKAAASLTNNITAIVSRGGRPDLAGEDLAKIKAPTLLIIGGEDKLVIDLNREAFNKLNVKKEMSIVPNATHLFEEPGTLNMVAELAKNWFIQEFKQ